MEKTTVYLTTDQKRALARAAQAEDRSEARLIRDGIDAVTARHRTAEIDAVTARHRTAEQAVPLVDSTTSHGAEPAAYIARRPRWMARDEFVRRFVPRLADAALRSELRDLAPGSTDEVELR